MELEPVAIRSGVYSPCRFESYTLRYAVCPGGEGAVLKTVGCKRLAGSNPVYGVCPSENPRYVLGVDV